MTHYGLPHLETPHFKFPFQRGAHGHVEAVEQDAPEHVMSCVDVIVRCPLGWRKELPDFGIASPEFHNIPLNPRDIELAIEKWEERARIRGEEYADIIEATHRHLTLEIQSHG